MTQLAHEPKTCPTCGAVIPEPKPNLTPSQLMIYNYVAKRPGVDMHQIFNHLYASRPDGGPLCENVISQMIHQANKRLVGQRIQSSRRGPGATYRLVKEPTP